MAAAESVDGCLLVDKPTGWTSHDVVAHIRRVLGIRRVGHTGTLDPFATGLLILLIGRTTRLSRYISSLDKTYTGLIHLGITTDTGDPLGTPQGPPQPVVLQPGELEAAARSLVGPRQQVPPAFSAKKVQGRRAYRLARSGHPPELAPVPVTIHRFDVAALEPGNRLRFRARVSSGTYLRVLAADLGRHLGCGAHLEELRRDEVGPLRVDQALRPDRADPEEVRRAVRPPEEAPLGLPTLRLSQEEAVAIRQGRLVVRPTGPREWPRGPCRLLDPGGRLLGVGENAPLPGRALILHPRVVLGPPGESGGG